MESALLGLAACAALCLLTVVSIASASNSAGGNGGAGSCLAALLAVGALGGLCVALPWLLQRWWPLCSSAAGTGARMPAISPASAELDDCAPPQTVRQAPRQLWRLASMSAMTVASWRRGRVLPGLDIESGEQTEEERGGADSDAGAGADGDGLSFRGTTGADSTATDTQALSASLSDHGLWGGVVHPQARTRVKAALDAATAARVALALLELQSRHTPHHTPHQNPYHTPHHTPHTPRNVPEEDRDEGEGADDVREWREEDVPVSPKSPPRRGRRTSTESSAASTSATITPAASEKLASIADWSRVSWQGARDSLSGIASRTGSRREDRSARKIKRSKGKNTNSTGSAASIRSGATGSGSSGSEKEGPSRRTVSLLLLPQTPEAHPSPKASLNIRRAVTATAHGTDPPTETCDLRASLSAPPPAHNPSHAHVRSQDPSPSPSTSRDPSPSTCSGNSTATGQHRGAPVTSVAAAQAANASAAEAPAPVWPFVSARRKAQLRVHAWEEGRVTEKASEK
mmetsp:Transcript_24054/g.53484  ORF Transcript_24054/g.53484 Transcript_24054/m.53484 type:complete len:517 (+) Transcript_24054:805-2355(+)